MTEDMLFEEQQQGVAIIAATPHFYASQMSVIGFLGRRKEALDKTNRIRQEADRPLPEIIAGAEVYYFSGIGRAAFKVVEGPQCQRKIILVSIIVVESAPGDTASAAQVLDADIIEAALHHHLIKGIENHSLGCIMAAVILIHLYLLLFYKNAQLMNM